MEHEFAPTEFYNTIGSHPCALSIKPGDTVRTWTADSRGRDAQLRDVAGQGNPMTGPFFVEGASAGDTLAVTFHAMGPNRDSGWSRIGLAPLVLDPAHAASAPGPAPRDQVGAWAIDTAGGTVAYVDSDVPAEAPLMLPIAPMLGCVGVAPERGQAISTSTSGPHGGNMDYCGVTAGVTLYFPVFVPGALFHLGDGHARQGHGEISGSGVETSFDVEFSVEVLSGIRGNWPRGENDDYIFTMGNARPLDQCLQHATTEMLSWLQSDFDVPEVIANLLMGQAVEYEVGNMFDPAYTVVCKISKKLLETYASRSSLRA